MRRIGIIVIFVAFVLAAFSQESVNSGFGTVKNKRGYSQTFSVGQIQTNTYRSKNVSVLHGIQQDFSEQKTVVVLNTIADIAGNLSDVIPEIDLSEVFVSVKGHELTYIATSSDPSVVIPVIVNGKLSVVQYGEGNAIVTVTASDGSIMPNMGTLTLSLRNRSMPLMAADKATCCGVLTTMAPSSRMFWTSVR